MDDPSTAGENTDQIRRRIQTLAVHLSSSPSSSAGRLLPSPCGHRKLTASRSDLTEFLKGEHREIQEKIFDFFLSRPELQTPVEISTAEHRELCMRQLTALVKEAGIRPFRYVVEDPSLYFAIVEAAGGIDISLGIKMGVQYRWGVSLIW